MACYNRSSVRDFGEGIFLNKFKSIQSSAYMTLRRNLFGASDCAIQILGNQSPWMRILKMVGLSLQFGRTGYSPILRFHQGENWIGFGNSPRNNFARYCADTVRGDFYRHGR
jgi:hypothetical protein